MNCVMVPMNSCVVAAKTCLASLTRRMKDPEILPNSFGVNQHSFVSRVFVVSDVILASLLFISCLKCRCLLLSRLKIHDIAMQHAQRCGLVIAVLLLACFALAVATSPTSVRVPDFKAPGKALPVVANTVRPLSAPVQQFVP